MKRKIKMMIFALVFALVPFIGANAETVEYEIDGTTIEATEVATYTELVEALGRGESVSLTTDITVPSPIEITFDEHEIYIFGEDHKLDGEGMVRNGANGSIITAFPGTLVYVFNLTIENANKYGIQAYDTGIVALSEVTIKNCNFGAILVNGGGLIVGNLTMKDNGNAANGGNGIELGKGAAVTEDPAIIMVGEITVEAGTQTSAITLAENDNLSEVTFANYPGALNTLVLEDNKLVVKDSDGTTKYTSNDAKAGLTLTEDQSLVEDIPDLLPEEPEPTPEVPSDQTTTENPNTYDGILGYVFMAVLGLLALAISAKKVLNKVNA